MANGEGALEAQQRIAAEIPYKNLAQRNPAEQFLSTFFTAQQIGNQRRRLEEQLLKMEMDTKFKEQNYELNVAKLTIGSALQTAEHNRRMEAMQNQLDLGAARINLQQNAQDYKEMQDKEKMEGTSALITAASSIDKNDPKFLEKISSWATDPAVARALQTPLGRQILKGTKEDFNQARRHEVDLSNAKLRGFESEVKDTFGFADNKMFLHPEWWIPTDNTGKQKSYMWHDSQGHPQYITLPSSVVNSYTNRYKQLMKERENILPQINDDDVKAQYPSSASMVRMKAPDGSVKDIPKDQASYYEGKGAVILNQ